MDRSLHKTSDIESSAPVDQGEGQVVEVARHGPKSGPRAQTQRGEGVCHQGLGDVGPKFGLHLFGSEGGAETLGTWQGDVHVL